jgi:TonB-linked SusC/RagA family outer membrane protein
MKKITSLLVFLFLVGFIATYAQNIQIKGKVTGLDEGNSLPGVSVVIKGTTTGTATDADGNFELSAPADAVLVFSSIGYAAQEVTVGGQTMINIGLQTETLAVDEVIVTALGITRDKKALGYSIQQIDGDEVNRVRETNFVSSLSGKVAGVQVKQANTMGGSVNVLVRGSSSLTGNNQAMFVIDGVPVSNDNTNNVIKGYNGTAVQMDGWGGYDYGNAAADLNPDDIESISILKGAAATALYGSRAANGVILVTTKKGVSKKGLGVSVNSGVMFSTIDKATSPKQQNKYGAGYGAFYEDATGYFFEGDINGDGINELMTPCSEDASWGAKFDPNLMVVQWDAMDPTYPNFGEATPWVAPKNDYYTFFETGVKWTNNIALDGGNDKGTFRISYTNIDEKGILPNSKTSRNTVNFSGSYKLTSRFTAEANVSYINNRTTGRYGTGYSGGNVMQSFGQWFETNVDFAKLKENYITPDGRQRTWNNVYWNDLRPYFFDNPYWVRYKNYSNDGRDRVLGYTKLSYKFTDWLRLNGRASLDYSHEFQEERTAIGSAITGPLPAYNKFQRVSSITGGELFLSVDKNFGFMQLNGLLGVATSEDDIYSTFGTTQGGLAIPDFYSLTNTIAPVSITEANDVSRINSTYGSLNLGFSRLVFVELAGRADKSSTLPANNNLYFYPSVSTSIVLTEIEALKNSNAVSFAKIRINYAQVGNDAPVYSTKPVYAQGDNYDNQFALFSISNTLLNPELKPERTKSFEAGIEMNFLNNRVGFDLSGYSTVTFDQIMPVTVSNASGYAFNYINGGEISNKGLEVALKGTPVFTKSLKWEITVNWFMNRNKVVKLYEDIDNYLLFSQWDVSVNARVGEPYGNIEGTNFVYTNGKKTVASTGYYLRTAVDETLGNINPDWNMGINNAVTFKGLTLSFLVDIQQGGDIYSVNTKYGRSTGVYAETATNNELGNQQRNPVVYNTPGDPASGPAPDCGGILFDAVYEDGTPNITRVSASRWGRAYDYNKLPTAEYVFDASYVKLREASLSYAIPASIVNKTPLKAIELSAVGRNLWIIHKNTEHFDPEAALSAGNQQGIESGSYPTTRNIGFDIKLIF